MPNPLDPPPAPGSGAAVARPLQVLLHFTGQDGLPDDDLLESGRVAFLWGTEVLCGWPIDTEIRRDTWQSAYGQVYGNVTHWLEFPNPIGELTHGITRG